MGSLQVSQRVALITGAAKGIGASIADVLAQQGMHVLIRPDGKISKISHS